MALNSLYCADVPLSNYSLTHSLTHSLSHANALHKCLALFVDDNGVSYCYYSKMNLLALHFNGHFPREPGLAGVY